MAQYFHVFDTLTEAQASVLPAGVLVKTKGGTAVGDGQGGEYITQSGGVVDPTKPSSITGASVLSTDSSTERTLGDRFSDIINVKDFGAVGDGVVDDTDALEAAIDVASGGWTWQGSVSLTNRYRNLKGKVYIPPGVYRITRSLRLPPCITIEGAARAGYWNTGGTSSILADFSRTNTIYSYVLDTAPYDSSGNISWGRWSGRTDWDSGLYTGHHLITLRNLTIDVLNPSTNLLDGCLNLNIASESVIEYNSFRNAACGIALNTSWAGKISNNNIFSVKCIGIAMAADVTTYVVENNYISTAKTWGDTGFAGPIYPDTAENQKTAGVALRYANPKVRDNTFESSQQACRSSNNLGGCFENNYFEGITEFGFKIHTSACEVKCGTWLVPADGVQLAHFIGSESQPYKIDITGLNGSLPNTERPVLSQYARTYIESGGRVIGTQQSSRVEYINSSAEAPEFNDIYMSATGNDDNHGLRAYAAVATWQTAIERCVGGKKNRIYIADGETVTTKTNHNDGTRTDKRTFVGLDIEVIGNTSNKPTLEFASRSVSDVGHAVPLDGGSLRFSGVIVKLPDTDSTSDYKASFMGSGHLTMGFYDCEIIGNTTDRPYLMGVYWARAALTHVVFNDCILTEFYLNDDTSGGHINMWVENNANCTITDVLEGNNSGKIKSTMFP